MPQAPQSTSSAEETEDLVSIIIPFHNAAATLEAALASCAAQTHARIEVCACDDASADGSAALLQRWAAAHAHLPLRLHAARQGAVALGPAAARNRAASLARGTYLCFLDADDEMLPCRVALQLAAARRHPGALIGASFVREPPDATPRYAAWANSLSDAQLVAQAWRECTLLQPTWFLAREAFVRLGGYDEVGPVLWGEEPPPYAFPCLALDPSAEHGGEGSSSSSSSVGSPAAAPLGHAPIFSRAPLKFRPECLAGAPGAAPLPATFTPFPEDPLLFHRHLTAAQAAGMPIPLHRVPTPCLLYRYSSTSLTWRVSRNVLLACKAAMFEERVMATRGGGPRWVVWGAGRDGKAFYKALSPRGKALCGSFLDLDPGKIGQCYPPPVGQRRKRAREAEEAEAGGSSSSSSSSLPLLPPLPIRHFTSLGEGTGSSPAECCVAVCVALDAGGQELLDNVQAASRALVGRGGRALEEGVNLFFLC